MTTAESLKRFRSAFKLTQQNVADLLNMSQQSYYYYENKGGLSAENIVKLAAAYNVSTDYLLGFTDNPAPNTAPPAESAGAMSTAKATGDTAPITEERINQLEERLDRYDSWFKRKGIDI